MEKKTRQARLSGIKASRRAADDFLRAGRRNELKKEGGFALHDRFSQMSDEEFDKAVADGSITPEQRRQAGEWAWDTYMGDVWMEQDENFDKPEPTYEEFMSDPAKYGYDASQHDYEGAEYPDRFYRYKPGRYDGKFPAQTTPAKPARPEVPSSEPAPADNTAVAKKPVK